jgi:predicted HicB family RNase H-like nuclease
MKRRDDQITLRLAGSLRAELERAAAEDGRSLSNLIRAVLADFAAQRVVDRATQAA